MDIIRFVFSVLWFVIAILVSWFLLWRTLRRERVDNEEQFVDGVFLAVLGSAVVSRFAFIIIHFKDFTFDISKWLNFTGHPGFVPWFLIPVGLWILYKRSQKEWKDPIELLDYSVTALCALLVFVWLHTVLVDVVFLLFARLSPGALVPVINPQVPFLASVMAGLYLLLRIALISLEKKYRTFLWYRAKRSSAQTGFVLATFLMAYGAISFFTGWFLPSTLMIGRIPFDPLAGLLVMVSGFVLLYVRSGRSIGPLK